MPELIRKLDKSRWPELLKEMPDPPDDLYFKGNLDLKDHKLLCVVGSRKYSPYGKYTVERLIEGLKGEKIIIISGLALGIDSLAHKSAMEAKLKTIAIPGSGLKDEVIYPRIHLSLSREIVKKGGALISEFAPDFRATHYSFPLRNRIMAGISHATLIIEAEEKSGTLITARLAMEYNREVLAVPGPIHSKTSIGVNNLIKDGARVITSPEDIKSSLNLQK